MSTNSSPQLSEQVLHIYTAVNYAPGLGAGIGISQEIHDAKTDQVTSPWTQNRAYYRAWHARDFAKHDIETSAALQMRAFREALDEVRIFYKKNSHAHPSNLSVLPRKVVIHCQRQWIVNLLNHHLDHDPDIPADEANATQGKEVRQLRAISSSIRRISRRGVQVSIVTGNPVDYAFRGAKALARHRRVQSCGRNQTLGETQRALSQAEI